VCVMGGLGWCWVWWWRGVVEGGKRGGGNLRMGGRKKENTFATIEEKQRERILND